MIDSAFANLSIPYIDTTDCIAVEYLISKIRSYLHCQFDALLHLCL